METLLSICLGLGLAAACGFRVFVPLLVMALGVHSGHIEVSTGFAWVGSDAAVITLAVATVLEVLGYYVPWIDNLLDSVATPAAVVAGALVTASVITDMSPLLRWGTAVVAGGGVAAAAQGATLVARQVSSWTTFGVGNPLLATAEAGGALGLALLSVLVPLVAAVAIGLGFLVVGAVVVRHRPQRATARA